MSSNNDDPQTTPRVPPPLKYSRDGIHKTQPVYAIMVSRTSHHDRPCPQYRILGVFEEHFAFPSSQLSPDAVIETVSTAAIAGRRRIAYETYCRGDDRITLFAMVEDMHGVTHELNRAVAQIVGVQQASQIPDQGWMLDGSGNRTMWIGIGTNMCKYRVDVTQARFRGNWDWKELGPAGEEDMADGTLQPCGGKDPER